MREVVCHARALSAALRAALSEHGLVNLLVLYDPARDLVLPIHSFTDTAQLERVLALLLARVRSGEFERDRMGAGAPAPRRTDG